MTTLTRSQIEKSRERLIAEGYTEDRPAVRVHDELLRIVGTREQKAEPGYEQDIPCRLCGSPPFVDHSGSTDFCWCTNKECCMHAVAGKMLLQAWNELMGNTRAHPKRDRLVERVEEAICDCGLELNNDDDGSFLRKLATAAIAATNDCGGVEGHTTLCEGQPDKGAPLSQAGIKPGPQSPDAAGVGAITSGSTGRGVEGVESPIGVFLEGKPARLPKNVFALDLFRLLNAPSNYLLLREVKGDVTNFENLAVGNIYEVNDGDRFFAVPPAMGA